MAARHTHVNTLVHSGSHRAQTGAETTFLHRDIFLATQPPRISDEKERLRRVHITPYQCHVRHLL